MASAAGTTAARSGTPTAVTTPSVSKLSLAVKGTPCSGPGGSPLARAWSASRARSMASGASRTTALSRGFTDASLSRWAARSSAADSSRARSIRASRWAGSAVRPSTATPSGSGGGTRDDRAAGGEAADGGAGDDRAAVQGGRHQAG